MATNISGSKKASSDQALINGIAKHQGTLGALAIGGQSFKPTDILPILQSRLDTANAAQKARAAWLDAVKAMRDEQTKTRAFVLGLRQTLRVAFAGSNDTLADFGLTPRKVPVLSPEAKVAAAVKAKATRAARHTLGKRQKQAIKGAVPPTAPASPPVTMPPSNGGTLSTVTLVPAVSTPASTSTAPAPKSTT